MRDVHLVLIRGENGVFLPPQLCPVDLILNLLTGVLNDTLNLLDLCVIINEVIQGYAIQLRQSLCLANVWQRFICFP